MHKKIYLIFAVLLFTLCGTPGNQNNTIHTALAPAPDAGSIFIYPERIVLEDGGFFDAERGMMFVPVNRSKNNSDVIGIEIYRFKASENANPDTPPVFFLHGGPSFAGLERSLEDLGTFEDRWQPLTDISDVVVVGQRGIGSSKPNTVIDATISPLKPDTPYNDESAIAKFQSVLQLEKSFWEDSGLDLSGFTILEMVEDVNEVRQAFGYDKIIIWGGSFGSHWAMNIMRSHPEIVERAILRGMEGVDHTYDHPGHLWNVYKRIAEEVEADPDFNNLIPPGGLIEAVKTLIKRAEESPFMITVNNRSGNTQEVLFNGEVMQLLSRGYSGGLPSWAADIITMYNGDFTGAAERIVSEYNNTGRTFRTASYYMLDHGSGITPGRLAEYDADPAMDILGRFNWNYTATRSVWNSDLGDDFRQNFDTEIPTVIVQGTWDTSTPYENALELVPYFKNSKFIPVVRGPHGAINAAMNTSEVFRKGILHFAATGDWSQLPDEVTMPEVDYVIPKIK